jgi:hypothetical protein
MTTQIRQQTAYITKHSPNTVIVFAADTQDSDTDDKITDVIFRTDE